MSNHLAIATVTEILANDIIKGAVDPVISGVSYDKGAPKEPDINDTSSKINVFLFHVSPNPSLRNAHLPVGRGTPPVSSRVALDLHYLISFFGDASNLMPQRLLGLTVRALEETPQLERGRIEDVVATTAHLVGSDLASQAELVRFSPLAMSLDELSKVWSIFFQVPYVLSVGYRASVVYVDGATLTQPGPPVRTRSVSALPASIPYLETVSSAAGTDVPIVAGSTLRLVGRRLSAAGVAVRVLDELYEVHDASPTEIQLPLPPTDLRSGLMAAQVVHSVLLGQPPTPRPLLESNARGFMVHPTIGLNSVSVTPVPPDTFTVELELSVDPPVREDQRAVAMLTELGAAAQPEEHTVAFGPAAAELSTVQVTFEAVSAGTFRVALQVDGALSMSPDPAATPQVVVS